MFLAVTAEEKGLLGSEYYADQPALSAGEDRRRDQHGRAGRATARRRDFTHLGQSRSSACWTAGREGEAQGRASRPIRSRKPAASSAPTISPSPSAACRRSFGAGQDLVKGGVAARQGAAKNYTRPSATTSRPTNGRRWAFTGMAEDVDCCSAGPSARQFARMAELGERQRIPRRARPSRGRAQRKPLRGRVERGMS